MIIVPSILICNYEKNVLLFHINLSLEQQNDCDLLKQNYTTNVDNLKARLKAAEQLAGQDIVTIPCDIHILARRAYRVDPHPIDQIVLTKIIEGLRNSKLRWDLRKMKPSTAHEALILATELNSSLDLER